MEQTKIQFIGGLDTIGGNIVSIEHGNYRVITDFGAQVGASIEDQLSQDLFESLLSEGKLPRVHGVYAQENLIHTEDTQAFEDADMETIVCLSHLHIDHIGSLKHLVPEIPIFALADVAPFYELLVENHLLPDYDFSIQGVEPQEILEFGPFNIRFFESDHDTLGAASLFIESPDLKIVYSGDLRLTGFHPERVMRWALEARDWGTDVLLLEGTSFSFDDREVSIEELAIESLTQPLGIQSEGQGINEFSKILSQNQQACITFNGYPQNVERMVQWLKIAKSQGRQCVIQADMFDLVRPFLSSEDQIEVYSLDNLSMYQAQPERYFIQVDDSDLSWLTIDSKGIYLHSNGMPLGYYMPGYAAYVHAIVDAGWTFVQAGISGHANKEDLLMLAYLIQPQILVPWHTFNRQAFSEALQSRGLRTWLPELHETFSTEEIQGLMNKEL